MSKKIYVFDTSVLLSDAQCFTNFGNNEIIIPLKVLEEVDGHKKRQDSVGANARQVIRFLDQLREKGSLSKGVRVDKNKSLLKVETRRPKSDVLDTTIPDNEIIQTALSLKEDERKVIVVSRDINMRVKCDALGLDSEDYVREHLVNSTGEVWSGCSSLTVSDMDIDSIHNGEFFELSEDDSVGLVANQFIKMTSALDEKKSAIVRYNKHNKSVSKLKDIKDAVYGKIKPKNKEQNMALNLLLDHAVSVVTLIGKAGAGKTLLALAAALHMQEKEPERYRKIIVLKPIVAVGGKDIGFLPGPQPLTAKVLTPTGWTTMGAIQPEDKVISRDGTPVKVLGVFPKGVKKVYKVTTTDDCVTECCEDHSFYTWTWEENKRKYSGKVRTLKEIRDSFLTKNGKLNHYIPRNEAVQFEGSELPIPPYLLGALLGDGSFGDAICIYNTDSELIEKCKMQASSIGLKLKSTGGIQYSFSDANLYNNKVANVVRITNEITGEIKEFHSIGTAIKETGINRNTLHTRCLGLKVVDGQKYEFVDPGITYSNSLKEKIHNLGLMETRAQTKFIPNIYKFAKIEDRLELLRGLMDTDGTVKERGEAMFCTTSMQLANDVRELVFSLGGKCNIKTRNRVGKVTQIAGRQVTTRLPSYEFTVSFPNKSENIFYISRKANRFGMKYMHKSGIKSIEEVGEKEVKCILIDHPEHLYITDDYIVTHNTKDEKLAPWLAPIYDNLEFLLSAKKSHNQESLKRTLDFYFENGIIEVEAMTYIRGRSLANCIIILDETQNTNAHEIKTILTRVGEGTKIILTGDIEQVDSPYLDSTNNGLVYLVEKFKGQDFFGHITFLKGERSKVATAASILL